MTQAVLADAQFNVCRILRPYDGFEEDYQGNLVSFPLMFSEGGNPLDSAAERELAGYAPNLMRGLSVPLGSRVLLYIPKIWYIETGDVNYLRMYTWQVSWRLRNVADFRRSRIPFHYPKQSPGQPSALGDPRVVIAAADNSVVYTRPEPAFDVPDVGSIYPGRATQAVLAEQYNVGSLSPLAPIGPLVGGVPGLVYGQGVAPSGPVGPLAAGGTLFATLELQAWGDEMMIGIQRGGPEWISAETWDFTGADAGVSTFFTPEYPDIGVYVMTGSAP